MDSLFITLAINNARIFFEWIFAPIIADIRLSMRAKNSVKAIKVLESCMERVINYGEGPNIQLLNQHYPQLLILLNQQIASKGRKALSTASNASFTSE